MALSLPREILMQDDVEALLAYDRWAYTKVLDACRKQASSGRTKSPAPCLGLHALRRRGR